MAVRTGTKLKSWKTIPIVRLRRSDRLLSESFARSCPPINTRPRVGLSMAAIRLRSVVFPLPEGPQNATNSPESIDRSTPVIAITTVEPTWYSFANTAEKNQRGGLTRWHAHAQKATVST